MPPPPDRTLVAARATLRSALPRAADPPAPGSLFGSYTFGDARKYTVCQRNSYPIFEVTYYIEWVITSWTDGSYFK